MIHTSSQEPRCFSRLASLVGLAHLASLGLPSALGGEVERSPSGVWFAFGGLLGLSTLSGSGQSPE
jgi:hypothetical protein